MNPPRASTAQLVLESNGVARSIVLDHFPFTLGRGADCHLFLAHPQVSREHASIDRDADGYLLRDTASRHGTFVNGMKVAFTRLRDGDRIALGPDCRESEIIVFEEPDAQSSTRSLLAQIAHTGPAIGEQSDLQTLSLFLKAAQSLNSYGAINDVLRTMLEYTLRITSAERGFVFLGNSADTLRLECWQDKEGHSTTASVPIGLPSSPVSGAHRERPNISYSVVRQAATSQLDFILSDVTASDALGHESLILNAIRSVVAIPLRGQSSGRLLGLLYLDSHYAARDFTGTGKQILEAIAHQAAMLLENLSMIEAEREAALLRKELDIAAAIQRQIIPQVLPEFSGLRLSARTMPCAGVGGDFYDIIPVANGFVAFVGDVCGKGVPAALLAAMVQGMLHAQISVQSKHITSLADTIDSVNAFVCTRAPIESYLTIAILRYNFPSSPGEPAEVELVNGGHIRPIIIRADRSIETVEDGDAPVGLLKFAEYHVIPLTLAAGDRIVLLSDGITEAENSAGTEFGLQELNACLTEPDPIPGLFKALDRFCRGVHAADDQTVLTIDRLSWRRPAL